MSTKQEVGAKEDWDRIPDQGTIDRTMQGLRSRNFNPAVVANRREALEKLRALIPPGSDVMTGSSTTLEEIGFVELLTSKKHPWHNRKDVILAEKDPSRQSDLRRAATAAEYFVGSVQAVTESGQVLGTDASGSRQGGYVYGGKRVIWVVGVNKIVPNVEMAMQRLHQHCVPLEDKRMKSIGAPGTFVGKTVIYEKETVPDRVHTILVKEKLGF